MTAPVIEPLTHDELVALPGCCRGAAACTLKTTTRELDDAEGIHFPTHPGCWHDVHDFSGVCRRRRLHHGRRATLQARNYYFSRDFSDIVGPNQQSKAEEWGRVHSQLQVGLYRTVGFGADAIGQLGIKLDSSRDRSGTGLLPVGGDGRAPDEYSRMGWHSRQRCRRLN